MANESGFTTCQEIALRMDCAPSRAWHAAKRCKAQMVKVGRQWLIPVTALPEIDVVIRFYQAGEE